MVTVIKAGRPKVFQLPFYGLDCGLYKQKREVSRNMDSLIFSSVMQTECDQLLQAIATLTSTIMNLAVSYNKPFPS